MRQRLFLFFMTFFLSLSLLSVPLHAETMADKIKSQMQEQEEQKEKDVTEEANKTADAGEADKKADASVMTDDVGSLQKKIDALLEKREISKEDVADLLAIRKAYESLPLSKRLQVANYSKIESLYESAKQKNLLPADAKDKKKSSDAKLVSSDTETKAKEYVFEAKDPFDPMSIVMRFSEEATSFPSRLILLSPEGKSYPITNSTSALKDDVLSLDVTNTENYIQLDIANASEGKWTLQSSTEGSFTKRVYLGDQSKIRDSSSNDISEDASSKKGKKGTESFGALLGGILTFTFVVLLLVFVIYRFFLPLANKEKIKEVKEKIKGIGKKKKDPSQEENTKDERPSGTITFVSEDHDFEESMMEEEIREEEMKEEDIKKERDEEKRENTEKVEEAKGTDESAVPAEAQEYNEGDTSLLSEGKKKTKEESDDIAHKYAQKEIAALKERAKDKGKEVFEEKELFPL